MRNPVKIKFKNDRRVKIPNPDESKRNGRFSEIWGNQCNLCGIYHPQNFVEVDHLEGHTSLKSKDDLLTFFESIVFVTADDLQLVCKDCHKIKSYAERMGITFQQAKVEKYIIYLSKENKDVEKLLQLGVTNNNIPSTKDKRKSLLRSLLLKEL